MDFCTTWDITRTVDYITNNTFQRVALQFPDELLSDAPAVATELKLRLKGSSAKVYVLADATYNSFSTDEVAAAHVDADCVIHYGHSSLNQVQRAPTLIVLPKSALDVSSTAHKILETASNLPEDAAGALVVIHDHSYNHAMHDMQQLVQQQQKEQCAQQPPVIFASLPSLELWPPSSSSHSPPEHSLSREVPGEEGAPSPSTSTASSVMGLSWTLPAGCSVEGCTLMWIGPHQSPFLTCLQFSLSRPQWVLYDPATGALQEGLSRQTQLLLRRRYALTERAREAHIVGILVGTLAAAGYLEAIQALQALAAAAGKKTYTMLMGKPNVAKLANFMEVEVWVMVAEPLGLILDSKEFLAPILTPFEAHLAFTGAPWPQHYSLGFDCLLHQGGSSPPGSSSSSRDPEAAPAGEASGSAGADAAVVPGASSALALANGCGCLQQSRPEEGKLLAVANGAEYLRLCRSYQGLATPATGAEVLAPTLAVKGRHGRAAAYCDEPPPT